MVVQSQYRAKTDAAALSVEGLGKTFGDKVAFAGVSFEIGHGEVFGFLGPNGAGKTTTVRTLGTLIEPTSGSAVVAGLPLTPANGAEIRRRIAIVPESPGLYTRLSVRENLECFADLYGTADPRGRITRALAAVSMADRADDVCGALSKGLRQRVALARLFAKTLVVTVMAPLLAPAAVFTGVAGVEGFSAGENGSYVLTVTDVTVAAPAVTRALVSAGADVLSIAESRHSLEDIYLELIGDPAEAPAEGEPS
jgi:ABC-type transport system involved in cytochrome c biogenesis ATPase subunit